MAKKQKQKKKEAKHYDINREPGKVSECGNFVHMKTGATFKRTVLPSVAERSKVEAEELLEDINKAMED